MLRRIERRIEIGKVFICFSTVRDYIRGRGVPCKACNATIFMATLPHIFWPSRSAIILAAFKTFLEGGMPRAGVFPYFSTLREGEQVSGQNCRSMAVTIFMARHLAFGYLWVVPTTERFVAFPGGCGFSRWPGDCAGVI